MPTGITFKAKRSGPLFAPKETRRRARFEIKRGVIAAQDVLEEAVLDQIPGKERHFGFNTGALKRSIQAQSIVDRGDTIRGTVASPLVHAPQIEDGYPKSAGFPDVDAIARWLQRKRLAPSNVPLETLRPWARRIAANIYRRSYAPPYQRGLKMFAKGLARGGPGALRELEAGAVRAAQVWGGAR